MTTSEPNARRYSRRCRQRRMARRRNAMVIMAILAVLATVFALGYLNPDIIAIEVDGQTVNLMTASNLALLTAYVLYAKDVFVKLKNLILSKTSGTPPEELAAEQETAE